MNKITVGSRELKTRLGTYLRRVQRGQTLVVTDRRRPVAELKPIVMDGNSEEGRLDELAAIGLLTRKSNAPLARIRRVRIRGKPLSATVIEGREDRF
jgi:prevent-host-death family protein